MKNNESVVERLRSAQKVVALTGAGVSKESGIPTFRDAQTGLWKDYDPERLATPEGFLADPPLVWQWYDMRREKIADVQPNPGHYALAELEKMIPVVVIVTQNIDGLHAKAGSRDIIELHGNITRHICFDNRHQQEKVPLKLKQPPCCRCGSLIRPDVVWFGEALPPDSLEKAFAEVRSADFIFVVGTSGLVQPAASLPYIGKQAGAYIVEVNPEETPITDIADCFLQGPSGRILSNLIEQLRAIAVEESG
jgi:NAD-dependent deacetylase